MLSHVYHILTTIPAHPHIQTHSNTQKILHAPLPCLFHCPLTPSPTFPLPPRPLFHCPLTPFSTALSPPFPLPPHPLFHPLSIAPHPLSTAPSPPFPLPPHPLFHCPLTPFSIAPSPPFPLPPHPLSTAPSPPFLSCVLAILD